MKLIDTVRQTLECTGRTTSVTTGSRMNIGEKYVKTADHSPT